MMWAEFMLVSFLLNWDLFMKTKLILEYTVNYSVCKAFLCI